MGEANTRGDFEERREQSIERQLEEAEIVIMLNATDGKLRIGILQRDEEPNQDSPALIFAAFLNANFAQLAGEAMALYEQHKAEGIVTDVPHRSIQDQDGQIAGETPRLVDPQGHTLQ